MEKKNADNPPRLNFSLPRTAVESALCLVLCFTLTRFLEKMGSAADARTSYATLLVIFLSPALFCGAVFAVIRRIRALPLFFETLISLVFLDWVFSTSKFLQTLWFVPACFFSGAVLLLLAARFDSRQRKKKPAKAGDATQAMKAAKPDASLSKETAQQRLAWKMAQRAAAALRKPLRLGRRFVMEAARLAIVFGLLVGLHYFCNWLAELSTYDLSGMAYVILYIPLLCWMLYSITGEVGPGRVVIDLAASCLIAGAIDPAIVERASVLLIFFFVFGVGFVVTLATLASRNRSLALLRARSLDNPAILSIPADGLSLPDFEEGVGEEEKRLLLKRRSLRKFRSQREHTRWYRHPWFSR